MSVRKARLILLTRKLDAGGAERQLTCLAKGLRQLGHDVHVLLFYTGGAFNTELQELGIPLHYLNKSGRWDAFGFLARLVKTLRDLKPDVVYSFLDLPNILATLTRSCSGRPKVIWGVRTAYIDMQHYDWLARVIPWAEARLSLCPDMVIANSQAGARWAVGRGMPATRMRVVENGIDTIRFRPDAEARATVREEWRVAEGERLIGLVGRLDPMKDHPTFLRACALLANTGQRLRFVCVGTGSLAYRNDLEALSRELGIAASMIWTDLRQDMPAVFNALDVLCSASSVEAFSNVVGEAMACGIPCVVTEVGDSARIVGSLGEVVPPGDPVALAAGLSHMLDRLGAEPELKLAVRERVMAAFSVEQMVLRTERLLLELL